MALKIRLRQQGRKNRISYRLVVIDSRNPRDGRYVESVGWYNPIETDPDKVLCIHEDRVQHWLDQGAQLTEKAESLVKRAAPNVIKQKKQKEVEHRAKMAAKRRARKKAKAKS